MKEKLLTTLKAWPIIAIVTIGLCFITTLVSGSVFGIDLNQQASLEPLKATMAFLVKRMCAEAGFKWTFFSDLFALAKIIVFLTVLVPVFEEAVFRWILWRLPKPGLPLVSAITSSALFSAAHYLEMPWPDNAFIALFFFGLAQCWLYRKTDSLWCPMLNHGLFNATTLVLLFTLPEFG